MVSSICVLIRKAPYGTEDAFAGLKLGLATVANDIETKVILMDDGVLAALKDQISEKIGMPSILDAINDLQSLDVKLHCVEEHLKVRGVQKEDMIGDIIFIREEEISDLVLGCDVMTSF